MNTLLVVAGILLAGGVLSLLLVLLIGSGGGGPKVPDLVGMSYGEATKKVEAAGLEIEVATDQETSGVENLDKLKVIQQDPKPGTEEEKNQLVTVWLSGLEDVTASSANDGAGEEPTSTAPDSQTSTQPVLAPSRTEGQTVCLDPGHSTNSPASEIDSATGLDVADNSGADGEIEAMWQLAQLTKARLEQMGYKVVLTKDSANSYSSLRRRADIGNTCSIVVRLHYDPGLTAILYPGEGQYKERGGNRVYVDPGVSRASAALAQALAPQLQTVGISRIENDMGGTSNNTGPAFVGSVLSRVPTVLIENNPDTVRGNPAGQEQVANAIAQGIDGYFQSH